MHSLRRPAPYLYSVILVLLALGLMYRPEHPLAAASRAGALRESRSPTDSTLPGSATSASHRDAATHTERGAHHARTSARVASTTAPRPAQTPRDLPSSFSMTTPRVPTEPRQAGFIRGKQGETLMDVARRVYGDEELARRLWLLNRDQVDRIDSALTCDLVLREPSAPDQPRD